MEVGGGGGMEVGGGGGQGEEWVEVGGGGGVEVGGGGCGAGPGDIQLGKEPVYLAP